MVNLWKYLTLRGVFCWITFQPMMARRTGVFKMYHFSSTGVADILGIFNGKPLAIEVKIPKGKGPTEDQVRFLNNIVKQGGISFVARSIEDIDQYLFENKSYLDQVRENIPVTND
jgi:penicillin-binding protein-related factor A (putative recombinase)